MYFNEPSKFKLELCRKGTKTLFCGRRLNFSHPEEEPIEGVHEKRP